MNDHRRSTGGGADEPPPPIPAATLEEAGRVGACIPRTAYRIFVDALKRSLDHGEVTQFPVHGASALTIAWSRLARFVESQYNTIDIMSYEDIGIFIFINLIF